MVRELFTVLPDRPMHLNPHCEFGREFSPLEIQMLLSQDMIGRADKFCEEEYLHAVVDPVADPPAETISALIILYSRTPAVEAAYLVRVSRPSGDTPSTLLIALELDAIGEEPEVVLSSSAIIGDTYRGRELVDLAFIKNNPVMWDTVRRLASLFMIDHGAAGWRRPSRAIASKPSFLRVAPICPLHQDAFNRRPDMLAGWRFLSNTPRLRKNRERLAITEHA